MCGIAGIVSRRSETLGGDLIRMLRELLHRGKDATGVAIYETRDTVDVRVSLTEAKYRKDLEKTLKRFGRLLEARLYRGEGVFTFFEGSLDMKEERIGDLQWELDGHPCLCVHSLGKRIKIYKDQGSAEDLQRRHKIPNVPATHGIGHVRLATESTENINFAHPFVSYLHPELALVHNGQFTNYFNMRRKLERLGVRFKTNNDSEMAAHFLAYQIREKGKSLEEALHLGLETFDGVFTLLVSTPTEVGALRDRLGIKPVLFFEDKDGTVLFGSEQICLTPIVSDVYATEMEPGGVRVWSV